MSQIFLTSSLPTTLRSMLAKFTIPISKINVAFISTAAEYEKGDNTWLRDSFNKFEELGIRAQEYTLTNKNYKQLQSDLLGYNFFHLSGGNSFYLLNKIKSSGFDRYIKERLKEGAIYSGESAGAVVAGNNTEHILKLEGQLDFIVNDFSGIGLVDCSVLPHWGRDDFKEIYKSAFDDIYNCTEKIVCLREEQFVYVEDNSIKIENVKFF